MVGLSAGCWTHEDIWDTVLLYMSTCLTCGHGGAFAPDEQPPLYFLLLNIIFELPVSG